MQRDFHHSLVFKRALDEIFRRYGGGRAGGERLLHHREYLELAVRSGARPRATGSRRARRGCRPARRPASGAAVMMVVLTEWERDANSCAGARPAAARGSCSSTRPTGCRAITLGVLFDLCKTLDLQLLIAAPEVARAEGNPTHRLVRHVTEDGREEVIVSGRRAASAMASAGEPADAAAASSAESLPASQSTAMEDARSGS